MKNLRVFGILVLCLFIASIRADKLKGDDEPDEVDPLAGGDLLRNDRPTEIYTLTKITVPKRKLAAIK